MNKKVLSAKNRLSYPLKSWHQHCWVTFKQVLVSSSTNSWLNDHSRHRFFAKSLRFHSLQLKANWKKSFSSLLCIEQGIWTLQGNYILLKWNKRYLNSHMIPKYKYVFFRMQWTILYQIISVKATFWLQNLCYCFLIRVSSIYCPTYNSRLKNNNLLFIAFCA